MSEEKLNSIVDIWLVGMFIILSVVWIPIYIVGLIGLKIGEKLKGEF